MGNELGNMKIAGLDKIIMGAKHIYERLSGLGSWTFIKLFIAAGFLL
jgi:hypothetical protein